MSFKPEIKYNKALSIEDNIKAIVNWLNFCLREMTVGRVPSETNARQTADTENREAVEQAITDLYLDGIQAQQDLTDLQIQILEGTK